jgi:hypothetical protein
MGFVKSDQKPTVLTWTARPVDDEYPGLWKYFCPSCGIVLANVELGEDAVCPKDNLILDVGGPVDVGSIGVEVSIAIPDATDIATEDP